MQLYYAKGTIAPAVAIGLEEAGLAYTPVEISFAENQQQSADYLAVNPKGRVPALVLDDGTILTETGAILDYIGASAPALGLISAEPALAAHMRAVMYYVASTMHVAHAHKMRGARWADRAESYADMTAKVPQTMAACAAFVEAEALRGDYVTGPELSIADPYLFTACNWLEGDSVSLADYPNIAAFVRRMEARESVKAVRAKGIL